MKERRKYAILAFLINLGIALAVFVPYIIKGGGVLNLGDDFDAQELVFGMLANREIKEFDVFFNWAIDMGSDFITSFGFYNLGSPFFWITLPFKPEVFPYLIGWVFIIKYAFAGLFSYLWLKNYTDKKFALAGSVLYAFCGYQSMNLVFYHFHDAVVFFPLLLTALDKRILEKKKGFFTLAVGINALVNWNFFIGEVIFLIIYYVVRFGLFKKLAEKKIRESLTEVGLLLLEGALGVGISAVLFLPSVMSMLVNSRVQEHLSMYEAFIWTPEDLFRMIKGLLLPAEAMNNSSLFPDMNWYSISAYLPMTGVTLLAVYLYNHWGKKRDWLSTMLIVSFVMSAVPILNSVFVLFYKEPYRRWYYMPIIMMVLATVKTAEGLWNPAAEDAVRTVKESGTGSAQAAAKGFFSGEGGSLRKNALISCGIVMALIAAFGICFRFWTWDEELDLAVTDMAQFKKLLIIGALGILFTAGVVLFSKKKKIFPILFTVLICGFAGYSTKFAIDEYKDFAYYSPEEIKNEMLYTAEDINPDILPYRYAMAENYYNKNMAYSLPTIDSFISMLDAGIFEFYDNICVHRHVLTFDGPVGTSRLLSARYTIAEGETAKETGLDEAALIENHENGNDTVGVYDDPLTPPIGFTYDKFISHDQFEYYVPADMRSVAMLNYLVVADDDMSIVEGILEHEDSANLKFDASMADSACEERLKECSKSFEVRRTGFTSVIDADSDKYAFFSVPFSKRWSASVNGNEVKILNINGLMAVPVYSGENVIEFNYSYRINVVSLIISLISLAATVGITIAGCRKKNIK